MLKKDCKLFPGDRPCSYNKSEGIKCDDCDYYSPINFKVLVIKLDALGDVLRTTSILKPLKKKYPNSQITWCTRANAKELFIFNEFVDELIIFEEDAYSRINVEKFDLVISLDTSKLSASLASLADGKITKGFLLDSKGFVKPCSKPAEDWLEMSAFDDVKIKNIKSYQKIIYEIAELDGKIYPPILTLKEKTQQLIKRFNLKKNLPVIGLNTGVGDKWISKDWPITRWKELIELLGTEKVNVILLGGKSEAARNRLLENEYNFVTNTGFDNSVIEFAEIVNLCDMVVTCDTFALHVATALSKKVVVLFGPTSVAEIELYGIGVKLKSDTECKCYYKRICEEDVSCMEHIDAKSVYDSIKSLL